MGGLDSIPRLQKHEKGFMRGCRRTLRAAATGQNWYHPHRRTLAPCVPHVQREIDWGTGRKSEAFDLKNNHGDEARLRAATVSNAQEREGEEGDRRVETEWNGGGDGERRR